MTLVDTSIWRRHIRQRDSVLLGMLGEESAGLHPFVLGELACGNLRNRDVTLYHLSELKQAPVLQEDDVRHVLEAHRLWGTGVGWIDVHILAAAAAVGWRVFSADRAMIAAARRMKLEVVE